MPVEEFTASMRKGMTIHRLNQKMVRLATIVARTIVEEFALPRKLKKIKPIEWFDKTAPGDDQGISVDGSGVDMEGMPNDLIYTYKGLLVRVVGICQSLEDAETLRKVTGNEVRASHAFQEACTKIHHLVEPWPTNNN